MDDPKPPIDPPIDPELNPQPEPDLRSEIAALNKKLGDLANENQTLRSRLDARELAPVQPVTDTTRAAVSTDPVDQAIEEAISKLDEGERAAPWTETSRKIVKNLVPAIRNLARGEANAIQWSVRVDDEFYAYLAERWGKPQTPTVLRQIERTYARDVKDLSVGIVKTPDGQTKPEYVRDYTASFEPVAEALERKFNIASQDIAPRRPEPRAATGDRGGTGRPPAPGQKGPQGKPEEVQAFVKEVQGV